MERIQNQPHSAEWLGEHREFWWNRDFLQLMTKRWDVANVHSVLDVGCGMGHWDQSLAEFLPSDVKIVGIDREEQWIETALQRTKNSKINYTYQVASAEEIPFDDASFDMVTCQTLLIHVPKPDRVLAEMYRVLKPGGLLVVAEPNNTITELVFDTVSLEEALEDTLKAFRFQFTCERGQQKLGLGFDSLGDVMPGFFQKLGLNDIKVYLSDKTSPLFPPYACEEQQIFIKQLEEWYKDDMMMWDKKETKQYYLAGGGKIEDFEELWGFFRERFLLRIEAIRNNTYATSGGSLLYLVSGRKSK